MLADDGLLIENYIAHHLFYTFAQLRTLLRHGPPKPGIIRHVDYWPNIPPQCNMKYWDHKPMYANIRAYDDALRGALERINTKEQHGI
jgi:hypothetical protein